ncbi:NudC [Desulforapulum autotrophicum HRM2]|uniref:NAD-capped RNA hydrolase NudC n=2 Tax=Desulforapulum autotrophicum TaxID=2296 RepID=C0QHG1_DESAH|nr:NudC [Desulforapulum autotrophicum HRM2]
MESSKMEDMTQRAKGLAFVFDKDRLVLLVDGPLLRLPLVGELSLPRQGRWFGTHQRLDCFVSELPKGFPLPLSAQLLGLRQLFGQIDDSLYVLAGRAVQILTWDLGHRFCSACATPLVDKQREVAKICPACSVISYPRLSPAVIMTVERGHEILLGRSPRFPRGMYSTLAGFVEPGETLEQAVRREVKEEVGVLLEEVRYFGSQPWPFPHSLMVGFNAEYAGGEIVPDPTEIEDARWFSRDALPKLPSRISIARKLIDNFLARTRPD